MHPDTAGGSAADRALAALVRPAPAFDEVAAAAARARQHRLTKPRGSLGLLEEVAIQLAGAQGVERPASRPAAAILFASDHPVTRHGVSAYPPEVTAAMVHNFVGGGAAASVLSRANGVTLEVVDVGVRGLVLGAGPRGEVRFTRSAAADAEAGDLRTEDALGEEAFLLALHAGAAAVDRLPAGVRLLLLGEMGIGNTTAAAAVSAALLEARGEAQAALVGAGTGVDGAQLERKREVVRDGVARAWPAGSAPLSGAEAVRRLGGRDLAALLGAMARGWARGMVVLVDGFIVTASALALVRAHPAARQALLFSHRGSEQGHRLLLEALSARPLLDLGLRLGEASGALLALPLVDHACSLHGQMATFEGAGVPDRA